MAPRLWLTALDALCLCTAPARSQQDSAASGLADESILFEEIPPVYGPSKHEQKANEVPSSVNIVTAADIQHCGYRTLTDLLRSVRGVYSVCGARQAEAGVAV